MPSLKTRFAYTLARLPATTSRTVSGNTTLTASDSTVLVDATAGVVTITLPLASTVNNAIVVQKIDATANAVNVVPQGSNTLNGGAGPVALPAQYDSESFASNGVSAWFG